MTSIVVVANSSGSRAVVRTADSAARQSVRTDLTIAVSGAPPPPSVLGALSTRLGAAVERAHRESSALNAAVQRTRAEAIALLQTPWRAAPALVERCAALLDQNPDVAVVIPSVRLQSPDGQVARTLRIEPTLPDLLVRPLATPPVFVVRRRTWEMLGGLHDGAGDLARCDWWLRLSSAGLRFTVTDEELAVLEGSSRDWWPAASGALLDRARFRELLEMHRPLLASQTTELVLALEMRFGQLLANHREELGLRDRTLAELDRVRAELAHHGAYLAHHGRTTVDWGDLRRTDPISRDWGYDRGTPIDRRYIDDFLAAHSSDLRGVVLEVQEDDFTRRFGGPRVTRSAVVDLDDGNPRATMIADLRAAIDVEAGQFDAIVLTQTLHVIDDMPAVIAECHRLLAPGGVLLATLPSASRVCLEYGEEGDLWRLTPAGARALFEPVFGAAQVQVSTYGSVLTNVAFLHGFACTELTDQEFNATDPYHPVLAGVRARKPSCAGRGTADARSQGCVLLYHRVADAPDAHALTVPAALLDEQLHWLRTQCHVMPLEQLLEMSRDGVPERAVAITFDDGYLDTLESAAPVLERQGLPATVFATTRWLGEYGEYWWDVLEGALLEGSGPSTLVLDLDGATQVLRTGTVEERRAAHDLLHGRLVHLSLEARDRVIEQLAQWSGRVPDRRRRPLLADELRELARVPGISIGAHTVNHLALPDQSPGVQERELVESVRALDRLLPYRVQTFAFPYGAVDAASAALARSHCRWSVSCEPRALGSSFDAARVPRLEVKRWNTETLGRELDALFTTPVRREPSRSGV